LTRPSADVTVDWLNGYTFVGSDGSGLSVVLDAPEKGTPRGMTPMSALLVALGGCSGMDVVAILGKRKQRLTSVRVLVSGVRPEHGYPKPFSSINVRYVLTGKGLEERYVEEAVRGSMEKYCSVAATVTVRAKIDFSYEIVEG
jgi:putative redox protein